MRVLWIVALLAVGLAGFERQPTPNPLAVVIDLDSPVANAELATHLRGQALAAISANGHPVYFELTGRSIRRVPDSARESFRAIPFSFSPATFSGISLTIAEASEILRKNESVRDAVIKRECRSSGATDCGGALVHAAATSLIAETERASAVKLRHLVEAADSLQGKTLVLVTAGWPFRDARRLNLDRAVAQLRARGISLVMWRLPSLVPYQGQVKDAAESLATMLSATIMTLNDERDIARLRHTLADPEIAAAQPARPPDTAVQALPVPSPDQPLSAFDPGDAILSRAASYVARFTRTFTAVLWRERYEQEARVRRRFNASGASFPVLAARRVLDSELFLVWLPREAGWIAVRDVIAIDGTPRRDGDRQLRAVLQQQAISVDDLKQLAHENGRFNIGGIVRTFNEPTLALLFLDAHYNHRFDYARGREQLVNGRRAMMYTFAERARPTVIQDRDRDVPARGTFAIDPVTGQVLHTSLELSDADGRLRGRMTVQYGPNARLDVLVPLEMRETYASDSGEEVTAVAVYTDFRRFETGGRLIVPQ